jgi:hypothetical protein
MTDHPHQYGFKVLPLGCAENAMERSPIVA